MVLLPLSVEVRAVGFSAFWHPMIFGLAKNSQENSARVTKNMVQQTRLFNSFHVSSESRKKKLPLSSLLVGS